MSVVREYKKSIPRINQLCVRSALDSNKELYTDAIRLWIAMWRDLLVSLGKSVGVLDFYGRWCSFLRGPAIFDAIRSFEDFDSIVIHSKSRDDIISNIVTHWPTCPYRALFVDGFSNLETSRLTCQSQSILRQLRSCCLFLGRIQGPCVDDSLQAWLEINNYVLDNCFAPPPIAGYSREISFPKGQLTTGSVSDVEHTYGKQGLKAKASCTCSQAAWKAASKLDLLWPPAVMYTERRLVGEPVAVVLGVPKNFKKNRNITKEPAWQAWAQHRVGLLFQHYVKRLTDSRSDPRSDDLNKWLICLPGYSTIDLTSASDTVHKDWINSVPWKQLRRAIWATRTPKARVGDDIVDINMAAGMGCGWTFPLECWVFSQLCEIVSPGDYAVFGDDIVVPDNKYDEMIAILEFYGFIPNEEKSFGPGTIFRESCGLHVFHISGHIVDVSPVRFPGRNVTTGIARSPESFIGIQRESSEHGWELTRYILSSSLSGILPFSDYWESELPYCRHEGVAPDPIWGTYSLPAKAQPRYSVSDKDKYPFALLQEYIPEPSLPNLDEAWNPRYPWVRKAILQQPQGWKNSKLP